MTLRKWWNEDGVRQMFKAYKAELSKNAAEYMASRARVHCPVDTAELLSSIIVMSESQGSRSYVQATAHYSAYVEFGHMTPAGSWVPPQPFMRMALADTKAAFPKLAQQINVGLNQGSKPQDHPIAQATVGA